MQTELKLDGLDGSNPMHFLAALGILRLLHERTRADGNAPRLQWINEAVWRPVFLGTGMDSTTALAHAILEDSESWETEAILQFEYPKLEKRGTRPFAGLKPPIAVYRAWTKRMLLQERQRSVEYACALMSETGAEETDPKKVVDVVGLRNSHIEFDESVPIDKVLLPTAFDFTSRNAQFLDQIRLIRQSLNAEDVAQELAAGRSEFWDVRRMAWDPLANTPGALFGGHQAARPRPASEWLAFRGLVYFPVFGTGRHLDVTGCRGRRLNGRFVWPIWCVPTNNDTVHSIVAYPRIEVLSPTQRDQLGIGMVFSARLTKAADGYSGRFDPSEHL